MDTERESVRELAKRLAAAYISYTLGVTLNTAYQKIKSEEPGEYWQHLARRLFAELAKAGGNVYLAGTGD